MIPMSDSASVVKPVIFLPLMIGSPVEGSNSSAKMAGPWHLEVIRLDEILMQDVRCGGSAYTADTTPPLAQTLAAICFKCAA